MTLSYRASGLLAHLRATVQPGQAIDTAALERPEHREGRDAIRAMLRELADAGHVHTGRHQDPRGRWTRATILLPASGNTQVTPRTENPSSVETKPQVTPKTGFPASVNPASVKPSTVNTTFPQVGPKTENPASENPSSVPTRAYTRAVPPLPTGARGTSTPSGTSATNPAPSGAVRAHTSASTGARTRTALEHLNATAVQRPDAYALVSTWAQQLDVPLRPAVQRGLAKAVDDLLRDLGPRADLHVLRAALDRWAVDGRTVAFLPHAYDDAARAARAQHRGSTGHSTPDVPASRVQPPTRPVSKRAAKALSYLAPDDPLRAEWGMAPESVVDQSTGFSPRVIEGGRSA